mmetsp:Transcript_10318/g.34194  ORF Transcript_10318/g.34194 Transcript_10318/m.34194 type:complete len:237 (-) Transcript_10318:247-957(-)
MGRSEARNSYQVAGWFESHEPARPTTRWLATRGTSRFARAVTTAASLPANSAWMSLRQSERSTCSVPGLGAHCCDPRGRVEGEVVEAVGGTAPCGRRAWRCRRRRRGLRGRSGRRGGGGQRRWRRGTASPRPRSSCGGRHSRGPAAASGACTPRDSPCAKGPPSSARSSTRRATRRTTSCGTAAARAARRAAAGRSRRGCAPRSATPRAPARGRRTKPRRRRRRRRWRACGARAAA